MAVKPIPEGYHTVTPYLTVQGVPKRLEFLKQASRRRRSRACCGRMAVSDMPRSG